MHSLILWIIMSTLLYLFHLYEFTRRVFYNATSLLICLDDCFRNNHFSNYLYLLNPQSLSSPFTYYNLYLSMWLRVPIFLPRFSPWLQYNVLFFVYFVLSPYLCRSQYETILSIGIACTRISLAFSHDIACICMQTTVSYASTYFKCFLCVSVIFCCALGTGCYKLIHVIDIVIIIDIGIIIIIGSISSSNDSGSNDITTTAVVIIVDIAMTEIIIHPYYYHECQYHLNQYRCPH